VEAQEIEILRRLLQVMNNKSNLPESTRNLVDCRRDTQLVRTEHEIVVNIPGSNCIVRLTQHDPRLPIRNHRRSIEASRQDGLPKGC
jgi:hypothetical protein